MCYSNTPLCVGEEALPINVLINSCRHGPKTDKARNDETIAGNDVDRNTQSKAINEVGTLLRNK